MWLRLEELKNACQSIQLFNHYFNMQKVAERTIIVSARLIRFKIENIFL
jgi:hypothetical protein